MSKNWVNEILDAASRVVAGWPEWMRRPEVRMTGSYAPVVARKSEEAPTPKSEDVGPSAPLLNPPAEN